ncbi:hypothetical protein WMY93_018177 [Mugilogobius chulae]|uniref:Integrase catalytic domain-containing protein n=1 Tax=Mugilogobius chulae TaxID=88201 RepID=A0AAW0NJD8_9GOBI
MAYQRFTALRGHPQKVWSDPGTNFIGAKTVLKDLYEFLQTQDKTSIEEYAVRNSTNWAWKVLPADSPHRNGAAEAAVKVAKRALQSLGKSADLTFSEFLTALQVAANLANQRPIDAKIQSQEDRIEYVTPNSLLMGRASHEGDFSTFTFESYSYKRLQEIETQVNSFWRAWSQLAGPNLFIRSKWHTLERNVAVGDIVWLCDQNALRGQFRLGRIVAAVPDRKGVGVLSPSLYRCGHCTSSLDFVEMVPVVHNENVWDLLSVYVHRHEHPPETQQQLRAALVEK